MQDKLIGMYDSGVGGLSVLKAVSEARPDYDIIYLGDTFRVPYGDRPREEIIEFSRQIIGFMIDKGVSLVVVACNTSSAMAIPVVREEFNVPIIEMIGMGSKAAVRATRNKKIGVIATNNTIKSGAYEENIKALMPDAEVYVKGCPRLVPFVESGEVSGDRVRGALSEYLSDMKEAGIDTLVYGCTHYPFLEEEIVNVMGKDVVLVDPAIEVASFAKEILGGCDDGKKGTAKFLVTGQEDVFKDFIYKNESEYGLIDVSCIEHLDISALTKGRE